jgi:hypothetical protein
MGRLSKSAFLVILLLLSGVSGSATHLCAMSSGSDAHACCMEHQTQTAGFCGMTQPPAADANCCQVVPSGSATIPSVLPSGGIHDDTYGTQILSDGTLRQPLPILQQSNRGAPDLARLRHLPVQALLCTFLV